MSDHAERIRAAHVAYRAAIGTDAEDGAYARLRDEVNRREILTLLEPGYTAREIEWMAPSCPSVDKARRMTAQAPEFRAVRNALRAIV
jgi:hypothetical protein